LISPFFAAAVIASAVGSASFVIWQYADVHRPANAISAQAMLADPQVRQDIMARYREKYGSASVEP